MEEAKRKRGVAWKWIAGIIIVLIVLIIAGIHFFKKDLSNPRTSKLKPIITDQLKKMIFEASDSLYHIRYNKFDFNIQSGNALITDFELIPDTAIYHRLVTEKRAPNMLLYFKCSRIRIDHFGFIKADSGLKFNVNRIAMIDPSLTVRLKRLNEPGTKDTAGHDKTLFKLAQKIFKRMNASVMTMRNFKLLLVNENGSELRRTLMHENIDITNFMTTPEAGGFILNAGTLRWHTPDSLYNIIFKDMRFSSVERKISILHAAVRPRLSKPEFYKQVKFAKDRYHFEFDHLSMNHFDLDKLLKKQEFHFGGMIIRKAWVEIYKNYNYPFRKVPPRRNAYPNRKLQTLAFDITIDTTHLYDGDIYHTIFPQRSKKEATLAMTGTSEVILNMTNIPEDKRKNPLCTVTSRTHVMNADVMHSKYVFNLVAKDGAFTYSATMGPMDMKALNPLTVPLGEMEMKAGTLTGMNMFLRANEYRGVGYINLYYKGMKINLLKRDKNTDTLKRMKFLSFVTNTFTPNDNPRKDGKFRKGPINIVRDPHESFFGFMWRAMLDGSTSAMMGFDQKKKKPDKNIIVKVAKLIAGPKKKHKKHN